MSKPMYVFPPKMQFFDPSTNQFLSGGKVFFYQPGTNTKLTTYPTATDAINSTNANPNPVILNTYGQPTIDMYVTQAFKMVVARSTDTDPPTGTLIVNEDNITTLGQLVSTSTKTTNYSVTVSDRDKLFLVDASGGAVTITLPTAASAGDGFNLKFKKIDTSANAVTIQRSSTDTIDATTSISLSSFNTYYECYSNGVSTWSGTNVLQNYAPVRWEHMQAFPSSGTFTVPSNVSLVFVEAWGGGGGGGANTATATASGGGGGAYASGIVSVTPNGTVTVTVAAGGTGATLNTTNAGVAGGSTSFGSSIVAVGGSGGTGNSTAGGASGGAAASCTGTCTLSGEPGQGGAGASYIVASIGGAAAKMGVRNLAFVGISGAANTGTGGNGGNSANAGGNGGTGYLVVYY